MSIKVQGQVVISNDKKGLFDQVNPGAYTTAERDALSPNVGDIVYNSQDEELQVWNGTDWGSAGSGGGSIGSPVDVLTPLDGAGVGGAYNYVPVSDSTTNVGLGLRYGGFSARHTMGFHGWEFSDIAYGNGTWVFLPENYQQDYGIPYSTDDGYSWSTGFPPNSNGNWKKIVFNGNKFVIMAQSHSGVHLAHSVDGQTWIPASNPYEGGRNTISFMDIACNPDSGRIIVTTYAGANAGKGYLYSDDDGATWTHVASAQSDQYPRCIEYGNGVWTVPPQGASYRAPEYSLDDGLTWQVGTGNNDNLACQNICYDPDLGRFVAYSNHSGSHYLWTSYDGINWSYAYQSFSGIDFVLYNIAYGNGRYFLWHSGYQTYLTSTNGSTWNSVNFQSEPNWGSTNRPRVFYYSNEANRWATASSYDGYCYLSAVGDDHSWSYYRYLTVDATLNSQNIYKQSDGCLLYTSPSPRD